MFFADLDPKREKLKFICFFTIMIGCKIGIFYSGLPTTFLEKGEEVLK